MSLLHYIQGHRKGKKAHRIELEAMHDPFMADALEGYEAVSGNHTDAIKQMQDAVHRRSRHKNRSFTFWTSIAASILLVVGVGWYLLKDTPQIPVLSDAELSTPSGEAIKSQPQARKEIAPKEPEIIINPVFDEIATDDHSILADMDVQKTVTPVPPPPEKNSQMFEISEVWADSMQEEEIQQMEEVVVIGYATRKRQSNTGVVSPILSDDLKLEKIEVTDYKDQPGTGAVSTSNNDLKNKVSVKEASNPVIGWKAYKKYLRKNIVHPTDAACTNIKGNVEISFHVDLNGRPYKLQVTKSLCETADQEAIRLITTGSNWTTGNIPVTVIVKF